MIERKRKEKSDTDVLLEWCTQQEEKELDEADAELVKAIRNVCGQVNNWKARYARVMLQETPRLAFDALNLLAASGIDLTTERGRDLFKFVNEGLARAKEAMTIYPVEPQ